MMFHFEEIFSWASSQYLLDRYVKCATENLINYGRVHICAFSAEKRTSALIEFYQLKVEVWRTPSSVVSDKPGVDCFIFESQ